MQVNSHCFYGLVFVIVFVFASAQDGSKQITDDGEKEAVEVDFYMMPKNAWFEKAGRTFRAQLAGKLDKTCKENGGKCTDSNAWFQSDNVILSSGYPLVKKELLTVKITFSLSTNDTGRQPVGNSSYSVSFLKDDILKETLKTHRRELSELTGYDVVRIGTVVYSIYPDVTINAVMIVLGLALLTALLITMLALQYWANKKSSNQEEEKAQTVQLMSNTTTITDA